MLGRRLELNTAQKVMLVLLRFLIGWHLLYQGLGKWWETGWSAGPFLQASRGPFSGLFSWLAESPQMLEVVDLVVLVALPVCGLCLMLGLFTRSAAISGGLLLLLFFLAAPPVPVLGFVAPSWQGWELYVDRTLIEAVGLLIVGLFPTGQILGLDILVQQWRGRRKRIFRK